MKTRDLRPGRHYQKLWASATLYLLLVGGMYAGPPLFQTIHSFGQGGPTTSMIPGMDGNFYGTIGSGGSNGFGAIYQFVPSSGLLNIIYSFTGVNDGANPSALIQRTNDGALFGTTSGGGQYGYGTVFQFTLSSQSLTPLYAFSDGVNKDSQGHLDGANPQGGVAVDNAGVNLYGTTSSGGQYGYGTVFQFNLTSPSLTTLYPFSDGVNKDSGGHPDGANPQDSPTLDNDTLYGTTEGGGQYGYGTVFQFNLTSPSSLTTLYPFSAGLNDDANGNPDGYSPGPGLALDSVNDILYGTTPNGGSGHYGTVFQFFLNSGSFINLYAFTDGSDDGGTPGGSLALDGAGHLFGTTTQGGADSYGTVFELGTNYSGGFPLWAYSFTDGSDGGDPNGVTLANGHLYGTTESGGTNGSGTIFEIPTSGPPLTTLYPFIGMQDGSFPQANLMLANDGFLYGTTSSGGIEYYGVLFKISPNGGGYQVVYRFASDAAYNPNALMQASDNNLYGTTQYGGSSGDGTIFQFIIAPGASQYQLNPLCSFTDTSGEGGSPQAGLIQATLDGNLYGTTHFGGLDGDGTIYYFTPASASSPPVAITSYPFSSPTGSYPAGLTQASDNYLYGTTSYGGVGSMNGTVFYFIPESSSAPVNLYSFTGEHGDGASPNAGLVQPSPGGYLYGTTSSGGSNSYGTIYMIRLAEAISTPAYQVLYNFTGGSDGGFPRAGLVAVGGAFYGTTTYGAGGFGTVFEYIPPSGSFAGALITLHAFTGGSDGSNPNGLILANGNLYGTTQYGGESSDGTVFKINIGLDLPSPTISFQGYLVFTITTANYYTYTIQQTASLSPPDWVNTQTSATLPANPIIGTGADVQVTVPISGAGSLYFRVMVTLSP